MIGRVTGTLLEKQAPNILLDVGGLGYEVQVPMTTLFELPEVGSRVTLLTHFVVREDSQLLYGFLREQDRSLFRDLIKVSGVGPKMGLAILSGMDTDAFVRSVQLEDASKLVQLPGVGRKTAARLLVEMRDRVKDWAPDAADDAEAGTPAANRRRVLAEAESALIALGYKPVEASKVLSALDLESVDSAEELIRLALQSTVGN